VNWFSKSVHVIEAVDPPETDADRLAEVERDYRVAERNFLNACESVLRYVTTHTMKPQFYIHNGGLYVPVNANARADMELQGLERHKQQALTARNELLRRRSELMMKTGMIR